MKKSENFKRDIKNDKSNCKLTGNTNSDFKKILEQKFDVLLKAFKNENKK